MIYLLDTKFIDLENNELYKDLPPDRIEKINRLVKDENKKLSLGAGLLLNFSIKDYCKKKGIPYPRFPLNIETNNHGKPSILGSDIHFNLSHSGKYTICVVDEASVGIDIQFSSETKTDISKKVLTEGELNLFGADIETAVKVFCIKEAILKKQGIGLSMGLKNTELYTENPNTFESKATLLPLSKGFFSVESLGSDIFTINSEEKLEVFTAVLEDKDGVYLIAQC